MVAGPHLLPFMQVSAFDALDKKGMPDLKADEYLEEWVKAERVTRRCVMHECHAFGYAKHSKIGSILFGHACFAMLAFFTCNVWFLFAA